jgi:hypothetical protein
MAVSGSKNYAITRANIIEGALRKLGVYDQGEAVSGEDTSAADLALNLMVKEWIAEGADIFLRTESTLFLQPDTSSYTLSTDHITDSYVETTLSAAEASGQTVISVTSSTGMTAADNVGIKMDDNTIHWSTIASVDSATQITIDDATDDDAASGNKVYAYTTKSDRPQKIIYAYRSDKNGFDTEVRIIGEMEYRRQSNKSSDGPPVEIWYNPQGNQSTGKLWVWPDDGGADWDKLVLICQVLPDDFDAAANNPDFPIEWGNALIWGLAAELASEYGLLPQEIAYFEQKARFKLDTQLDYDVENANVIIAMDYGR